MSEHAGRARARPSVAGLGLALAALLLLVVAASGAEPSPTPVGVLEVGGDPRSEGAGPGLVGSPLLVLGAVVLLGIVTAALTAVLARLLIRD